MKKNVLGALLASSMLALSIAGCGSADQGAEAPKADEVQGEESVASSDGTGEVVILYPGEETTRFKEFLDTEFNPRLQEEIGVTVKLVYLPWDQYWNQKEIMLAANETIDLYWDGLTNLSAIINKHQCQPLDELIDTYCQDMLKVLPRTQLQGGTVDGQIYGILSAYGPSSCISQLVCVREDILEAVGMDSISTPDDLMTFAKKAKEQFPEMKGPADIIFKPLTRYFEDEQLTWVSGNEIAVLGEDSHTIYSYYETEAFQKMSQFNEQMYAQGLYSDELTTIYNEKDSRMQTGLYLWVEGSLGKDMEIIESVRSNAPDAKLKTYLLAPEDPKYITSTGGEVLCVPYSAKNKEGAMRFLNWLYASEDNYRYAIYGVEGKDYEMVDGRIKRLTQEDFFYEWMFRNANYKLFTPDVDQEYIDAYTAWDDDAKVSSALGFIFNNENVKEIETAITEVIGSDFSTLRSGFVSFDDHYADAVQKLKDAGIDEYIAEVQRQYDEFCAQQGE